MRVLLLGATGEMGGRTASELLRRDQIHHLTLAGRKDRRLAQLAERLRGRSNVSTAAFDIRSATDLVGRMSKHDLVVSCAGPGYLLEERSVNAALEAGASYISLNDDLGPAAHLAGRSADAAAGVGIVSGCGAAPGLSNLLVALACDSIDEVTDIEIAVGASSRDGGGPAADLHFVSMLEDAMGASTEVGPRPPHPVYFPEPVGWIETFPCGHPEQLGFGGRGVASAPVRFRIGLAEKAVMDVIRASIATRVTAREPVRRGWLRAAAPLRPVLEGLGPGSGGWTAIRVDVHGRSDGRSKTVSYGVVDHLVNLASITIAEGAVRLAQQHAAGVAAPHEVFEPKSFLAAAARRGLRFALLEPHEL